jgi:hypothetical protein
MDTPSDDELAAIAAAYTVLLRRTADADVTPVPSRWRQAARTAILDDRTEPWRRSKRS